MLKCCHARIFLTAQPQRLLNTCDTHLLCRPDVCNCTLHPFSSIETLLASLSLQISFSRQSSIRAMSGMLCILMSQPKSLS